MVCAEYASGDGGVGGWFNFKQKKNSSGVFFLAQISTLRRVSTISTIRLPTSNKLLSMYSPKWRNRWLIVLNGRIYARRTHTYKHIHTYKYPQIRTHLWSFCFVISFLLCSIECSRSRFGWLLLLLSKLIIYVYKSMWFV